MAEFEKYHERGSVLSRIWSVQLVRRLMGLAGLAMIISGYALIMDSSGMADVENVTRRAVSGMVLVFFGGIIEVLVLLGWSRR